MHLPLNLHELCGWPMSPVNASSPKTLYKVQDTHSLAIYETVFACYE